MKYWYKIKKIIVIDTKFNSRTQFYYYTCIIITWIYYDLWIVNLISTFLPWLAQSARTIQWTGVCPVEERGEGHDKKFSRVHLKIVKIDITVHKIFFLSKKNWLDFLLWLRTHCFVLHNTKHRTIKRSKARTKGWPRTCTKHDSVPNRRRHQWPSYRLPRKRALECHSLSNAAAAERCRPHSIRQEWGKGRERKEGEGGRKRPHAERLKNT